MKTMLKTQKKTYPYSEGVYGLPTIYDEKYLNW